MSALLLMAGGPAIAMAAQAAVDTALGVVHYFPTEGNPVYMRRMKARAGYLIGSHKHKFEHYSILCSGRVRAEIGEDTEEYSGGDVIIVPAGVEHRITALTDIVWFCVHGTAETEGIDEVLIEKGV
jgi:quercetin dioxygenase-like cupin family protein